MIVFGAVGLVGNIVGLAVLAGGRGDNLNMRAAFLEVVNDALGSVAVLVAAARDRHDRLAARRRRGVAGDRGADHPAHHRAAAARASTCCWSRRPRGSTSPHVRDPHPRRCRTSTTSTTCTPRQVATGLPVLSAHVVVDDSCFYDGHLGPMLDELQSCLADDFDVEHSTIQFEAGAHADHEHETHA